jgi:large subunit ribosomal protein L25
MDIGGIMKLKVFKREQTKKSESNRIRREGNIPGVLYVSGKTAEPIIVDGPDFSSSLRAVQAGRLSTTIFFLKDENGKERRAILKEIQYEPTTYRVQHLDFEVLHDDVKVTLNVPIECTGVVDCVGVKLGGVLRQVIRKIRVRCLPKDIPTVFTVDVKNMAQNEKKRLVDLEIPNTVRPVANLNEVAVLIAKR